jgi:hypothetical protein
MDEKLVTMISKSPSKYKRPRILTIDECCNNNQIILLAKKLLADKHVDGCFPIWDQARVQADGSVIHVRAGYAKGGPSDFDWGKPKKRHSFKDSLVAQMIELQVINYDVLFLSENTRMTRDGVRRLLLNSSCREPGTHLMALYKKGKTNYSNYCKKVLQIIEDWIPVEVFQEVLI